jgi:hypothetical protein
VLSKEEKGFKVMFYSFSDFKKLIDLKHLHIDLPLKILAIFLGIPF